MFRVFVSSTYIDLNECREKVLKVLRRMGHQDVAMEYFVAEDQRPLDKCLRDVETCDLYVGIFAMRYGYIPSGHDKSITELEYRTAREKGIPCLIFLLKEDVPWPINSIDNPRDRIETLRQELQANHQVSFFSGKDDLEARITEAIYNYDDQSKQRPSERQESTTNQEKIECAEDNSAGLSDHLRAALDVGSELLTYFHTASGNLEAGFTSGIGASEDLVQQFANSLTRAGISIDSYGFSDSVGVVISQISVEAGNIFKLINLAQRGGFNFVESELREARKKFGQLLVELETSIRKLQADN